MRKIVIGQILREGKVMGTGFLVESDIVMTVKHNVVTADELITDEFEEKEIMFRMEAGDEVAGKTINLMKCYQKQRCMS
jgi:V8-like Glu-specific endopeptidase